MTKRSKDEAPSEQIDWRRVADDGSQPPARRAPFRFGSDDQPADPAEPAIDPWKELLERGSMHEVLASVRRVSGLSERVEVRPAKPAREARRTPAPRPPPASAPPRAKEQPAPSRAAAAPVPRFARPPAPEADPTRPSAARSAAPEAGPVKPSAPRPATPTMPPAGPATRPPGRSGPPPPLLLAERADQEDADRDEPATADEGARRIELDFVPRRLARPAAEVRRRRFGAASLVILLIVGLAAGIGFGYAHVGGDWSEHWRSLAQAFDEVEPVEPAGGPLPTETVGPLPEVPQASDQAEVDEAPAIPIPKRRPSDQPALNGPQLAAAGAADEVVDAAFEGPDVADLPPLFLGRVFVHYAGPADDDVSRTRAERIARSLETDGYRIGGIRPVSFAIRTSSVRYFFEADRVAATRLRDDLPPALAEQTLMMDFTSYEPRPRPGTIELWLADAG